MLFYVMHKFYYDDITIMNYEPCVMNIMQLIITMFHQYNTRRDFGKK